MQQVQNASGRDWKVFLRYRQERISSQHENHNFGGGKTFYQATNRASSSHEQGFGEIKLWL